MWKHFLYTLPNFEGCKGATFSGRKQNLYSFLSHFRKLHLCSLSIFRRKITEIDRAVVIPSEVVRLKPYPPQFLKFGHVPPHPYKQWLRKIRSIALWFLFRGRKRDVGPVTCTCASGGVQEVVVWTAFTSACHSEGSIFGPEKVKKN